MKSSEHSSEELFGTALLDRIIIESLQTLWEGELSPDRLNQIEKGIRAFIVSKRLSASRVYSSRSEPSLYETNTGVLPMEYDEPFGDHLLDYEFIDPLESHERIAIEEEELDFLSKNVCSEIRAKICDVLPDWIENYMQAHAYLDAWYIGKSPLECESFALTECSDGFDEVLLDNLPKKFSKDVLIRSSTHALLHGFPEEHAIYLVACHRQGMHVYSELPIAKICDEHIFSQWPDRLFQYLGEEFLEVTRSFRGPGIAVELPP